VVIGHSRGIGEAISTALWDRGWDIVGLSRHSDPALDLSWPEERIRSTIEENVGESPLDGLVLSGGMGAYLAPWQMTESRIHEIFATNLFGPIAVYRALLKPLMKARGRVLWIGSTAARKPGATGLSVYAASKGAVESFVYSESRRLAPAGIAMNVLATGWVETDMTKDLKPDLREKILKAIPCGRMASPEEIASFAASIIESPSWLTGEVLHMAGGG
jgi:3-oxoacyl-[acyl-carrier protein] reductase